jgi:succinate dehydrogenase / fumarate reductase cytochrome b subunit
MRTKRPVFLDLRKIKFPIMAIVSILHRVSGFILFFCIPFFLWALSLSLQSESSFLTLKATIAACLFFKIVIFLMLSALIYHLFAGIRHLLMDWGLFETLPGAKASSIVVFIVSIIFAILLGIVLC